MVKLLFIIPLVFSLGASAKEKARSMDDMHGDCSNYQMKLGKEIEMWSLPPVISEKEIKFDKLHSLKLKPQNQIKFAVTPEKFFSKDDSKYAGVFSFKVPSDGIYKVSSGSKVWFDVASEKSKKLIPSIEFEMQTKCPTIFKVVTFELQKDVDYSLQINSSPVPANLFLITNL